MKSRTILVLSAVIVVQTAIIVAGIFALYSGVEQPEARKESAPVQVQQQEKAALAEVEPQSEPQIKPQAEQEAEPQAKPEVEPQVGKDSGKEPEKKPEPQAKPRPKPVASSFSVTNCATGKKNTLKQGEDGFLTLVDHQTRQLWKIPFQAMSAVWRRLIITATGRSSS